MSSWGHWPSDKLLYPKVTFNGTEMFKLLWMCGIYWASCCGLWNVCSNNIQRSHWNSKTATVQWSNRPTGELLTSISPPTIYETYMILIKSMCFHTSISLTVSFWFICGMYCSVVVWFMMCLYLDARHKRNNYPSFSFMSVSLFTVPCIFGSQRYWGTEALHRIYNVCALSMQPAQLVDGIRCVGCLPGVTAEQKHLAVVHKDLQKNEEGLGTDDWRRTLQRADYLHNKVLQRGVQAVSAVLLAHIHHLKRPGGLWTFSVA